MPSLMQNTIADVLAIAMLSLLRYCYGYGFVMLMLWVN